MCRLRNIAMRDYQESVTTADRQTGAGQSDPYVPLCFAIMSGMSMAVLPPSDSYCDYDTMVTIVINSNIVDVEDRCGSIAEQRSL